MEQCFSVMLFIMLCRVFLTFEYADEILKCDHSLSCYAVYYVEQGGSKF